MCHAVGRVAAPASDVPDVLAPNLRCVFCGINPGRVSAAAHAHFANPRNDFWRLLHDAGFTPRLLEPSEQDELLDLGLGVTNAACRTTPGSGDLRRADFDPARIEQVARELRPRAIAFVGKEAYRGALRRAPRARPAGAPARRDGAVRAPVDLAGERRRALRRAAALVHGALREWIEPRERPAVRALLVDAERRTLLLRWRIAPGRVVDHAGRRHRAGRDRGGRRSGASCSRRRASRDPELGPVVFERRNVLPYAPSLTYQQRALLPRPRRATRPVADHRSRAREHVRTPLVDGGGAPEHSPSASPRPTSPSFSSLSQPRWR